MGNDDIRPVIDTLHEYLAEAGRQPDDGFRIKLTMPLPADVKPEWVCEKADILRGLGVHEFVPSLPVTSRDTARQLKDWAEMLGLGAVS
jgi:hypothetical protein